MNEYVSEHMVSIQAIEMDVNSQDLIDSAVKEIVAKHTHIDVLIHNAGHMVVGPAEAFTPEQLSEMYNINVLSTQRVNRSVLSNMWKRGQEGSIAKFLNR